MTQGTGHLAPDENARHVEIQIAGWLKRTHPEDQCNQGSQETIYRSLFVQARGVLKKELLSHFRSKRSMRCSRPVDPNGDKRGHIKDLVSIRQRPAAVEDRAVPVIERAISCPGRRTPTSRPWSSGIPIVMLAKVAGKDTQHGACNGFLTPRGSKCSKLCTSASSPGCGWFSDGNPDGPASPDRQRRTKTHGDDGSLRRVDRPSD
jgi:hypothetical protein